MSTRTETRLSNLMNKRSRLIHRLAKAEREHKATRGIQAKLVDVTVQQLKTERRIERRA